MKKFSILAAAVLICAQALALDDIAIPADFYDGARAKAQADALEAAIIAQDDAETTTDPTAYTPRRIGDILLGKLGGTNAVWVSRGTTTADWGIVSLPSGKFTNTEIADAAAIAFTKLAALLPARMLVGNASSQAVAVAISGDATISAAGAVTIGANKILESMLKAVDTASDEDVLTYEATTGDFEWHSKQEVAAVFHTTPLAATSLILTSAHYGSMVIISTNAAVALTLPANGAAAGSWIDVAIKGTASDDCAPTIAAATVDTMIGPNDVDIDSVTWGTGQRIGACARFWSDGSFWHVQNLGGTTMTYTD